MRQGCGRSGREEADILEINRIEEVEQIKQFSKIVIEWCTSQQDPMNRIKSLQSTEYQVRIRLDYIIS
jgi:intein-encoded DNA endonuclease-like protein